MQAYTWDPHHLVTFDPALPPSLPQPSPHRRDERPVSCYTPGSSLQPSPASLARDAASLVKDKQRGFVPNLVNNETYGTILNTNPTPAGPGGITAAPPLPPRNIGTARGGGGFCSSADTVEHGAEGMS